MEAPLGQFQVKSSSTGNEVNVLVVDKGGNQGRGEQGKLINIVSWSNIYNG